MDLQCPCGLSADGEDDTVIKMLFDQHECRFATVVCGNCGFKASCAGEDALGGMFKEHLCRIGWWTSLLSHTTSVGGTVIAVALVAAVVLLHVL